MQQLEGVLHALLADTATSQRVGHRVLKATHRETRA
jgi:hypothetical protein